MSVTPNTPTLRPYQQAAIERVQRHWVRGRRRIVVALPTGAGKTVIAAPLLATAPGRSLALVHTRTLLEQTRRRLGAGVRVATIQGVLADGRPVRDVDVVFVDECHHVPSASWHRVLSLLPAGVRIVGMTATPTRADGTGLGSCFDELVSTATYTDLLRGGWLAPCKVLRPGGAPTPAAAYLAHGGGRPGVLFAPSVAACERAVTSLRAGGVTGSVICGTTPDAVRSRAFAAFRAGAIQVLASPMALSEGFDAPEAKVCVLDRECVHVGVYLQTAGRVLRPHRGETALLIDLRGASARHGSPTDDREYHLHGAPIRRAAPPAGATRRATTRPPARTAAEVDTAIASVVRSIALKARAAWSFIWA